jgi:hypothetical protein
MALEMACSLNAPLLGISIAVQISGCVFHSWGPHYLCMVAPCMHLGALLLWWCCHHIGTGILVACALHVLLVLCGIAALDSGSELRRA